MTKDSRDVSRSRRGRDLCPARHAVSPTRVREGRDLEFGRTVGDILPGLISLRGPRGNHPHPHHLSATARRTLDDMAQGCP
ncbi:MAG: hypothetical protein MZV70_37150 [Desulfobacterales bacterium]|nr:hypothetical protein [Desulfobacterales bacterium]